MAHEFGQDPYRLMGPDGWTDEQRLVALAWLQMRWNKPDRGDNYLMAIRADIKSLGGSEIDPKTQKLTFTFEPPLPVEQLPDWFPKPLTRQQIDKLERQYRREGIRA